MLGGRRPSFRPAQGCTAMKSLLFSRRCRFVSRRHLKVRSLAAATLLAVGLTSGIGGICVSAVVGTPVAAQEDGESAEEGRRGRMRRGGGGFRGRGGFGGGGMMAARGGDATVGLLRSEAVQEEIELMADQKEALVKIAAETRGGERPDFDFRNATEDQRREFFEQRQKSQEERVEKIKLELEVILLPEQLDRLEQIGLQVRGPMALSDPDVIESLQITEDQQAAMSSVREEAMRTMRGQIGEMARGGDREAMRAKMQELRSDMEEKMLMELTSEQRKQFDDMKGEPFDMDKFGFGGRRGEAGRRGGAGGGPDGEDGPRRGRRGNFDSP